MYYKCKIGHTVEVNMVGRDFYCEQCNKIYKKFDCEVSKHLNSLPLTIRSRLRRDHLSKSI